MNKNALQIIQEIISLIFKVLVQTDSKIKSIFDFLKNLVIFFLHTINADPHSCYIVHL